MIKKNSYKEILEKANISIKHFSKIAVVNEYQAYKYFKGEDVKDPYKMFIDTAIDIIYDNDLEWPTIKFIPNKKHIIEYTKNCRKASRIDKKFKTAYKKALKKQGVKII